MPFKKILSVRNLNVQYCPDGNVFDILTNISFDVTEGNVFGITGSSGSGKSMTALSLMGLAEFYDNISMNGQIYYNEMDLLRCSDKARNKLRGNEISLIMQHPESALNPVKRVGDQIKESIIIHQPSLPKADITRHIDDLLKDVGFSDISRIYQSYPHELSGGQLQRIVIAMSIANKPKVIIADEATSSLDTQTALEIIELLMNCQKKYHATLIIITHEIELLKKIADHIIILKDGKIVDQISREDLNNVNLSPEASQYLNAILQESRPWYGSMESEICLELKGISKEFYKSSWLFWEKGVTTKVLMDINIDLKAGSMLGLLGKSGSGKTTLAKIITGIIPANSGEIRFDGRLISPSFLERNQQLRSCIQMIFQDALTSMNPKIKIGDQWREVIKQHSPDKNKEDVALKIQNFLEEFSLPESILSKYPIQISGGQRQRAALARTFLAEPQLIVFDESLSALDVFNQQKMVKFIIELQERKHFTGIFISHDPKLIKALCHEVAIIEGGIIIEKGKCEEVLSD